MSGASRDGAALARGDPRRPRPRSRPRVPREVAAKHSPSYTRCVHAPAPVRLAVRLAVVRAPAAPAAFAVALALALAFAGCGEAKRPPLEGDGNHSGGGGGGGAGGGSDGGVDSGGATALATGQPNPRAVATDASWVYFTCASDGGGASTGSVRRVPKLGGAVQVLASGLDSPYALFVSGGEAFFSTPDPTAATGTIFAVAVSGGAPRTVVSGSGAASWLATDGTSAYFPTSFGGTGASIERAPLAGGTAQLAAQAAGALTPGGLVVSGGWLYFAASGAGGGIYRAQPTGGGAEALDQESASFSGIALAGGRLWVTDDVPTQGRIVSVPMTGGAARVDATGIDHPKHVATDGQWVYFTSYGPGGSVQAVSALDGTVRSLAEGLAYPWDLTVDDAVYVTVSDGVMRLPRL